MQLMEKYRPIDFDKMVGNTSTITAIGAILKRGRAEIPHAWLFLGPYGCGKTTLGRIVAKKLGSQGMDYTEIDSAQFRGIDTIRDIRASLNFPPIESSCRIWLLDEVHRLSPDAKDGLLKSLEQQPAYVYFILCTAEPDSLPKGLRDRCIQFDVELLRSEQIFTFVRQIAHAEKKKVPLEVMSQIADDSLGCCRAALQILEKIIDLNTGDMMEIAKQTAERENAAIELSRALFKKESWKKIMRIVTGLERESPEAIRQSVIGYCAAVLRKEDNATAFIVLNTFLTKPFYSNGQAELLNACYVALNG